MFDSVAITKEGTKSSPRPDEDLFDVTMTREKLLFFFILNQPNCGTCDLVI